MIPPMSRVDRALAEDEYFTQFPDRCSLDIRQGEAGYQFEVWLEQRQLKKSLDIACTLVSIPSKEVSTEEVELLARAFIEVLQSHIDYGKQLDRYRSAVKGVFEEGLRICGLQRALDTDSETRGLNKEEYSPRCTSREGAAWIPVGYPPYAPNISTIPQTSLYPLDPKTEAPKVEIPSQQSLIPLELKWILIYKVETLQGIHHYARLYLSGQPTGLTTSWVKKVSNA